MNLLYTKKYKPRNNTFSHKFILHKTYKVISKEKIHDLKENHVLYVLDEERNIAKFSERSNLGKCFKKIVSNETEIY